MNLRTSSILCLTLFWIFSKTGYDAIYIPENHLDKGHSRRNRNDHTHNTKYGSIWSPDGKVTVDEDAKLARKLMAKLLDNYDKEVILAKPILVHMDVLLLQVKNTIEREGLLETVLALMIEWKDLRMRWDPSQYNNLTFLSLKTDQVWLPDSENINAADHPYSISQDSRFKVRASYNGVLKYIPAGTAKTWCNLNLITFPFDSQTCSLEFESWSLDSTAMAFDGISSILVSDSFESVHFQLCDHYTYTYYHTYNFTGETFTRIEFVFTVTRKSTYYVINLIFPILILSFIQTLSFLIPCRDTTADRIAFGTTNLLTLVVYQTIISEQLPKSSNAVSALSKYVISLIVFAALGIFESVIIERIQNLSSKRPPFLLVRFLELVPIILYQVEGKNRLERPSFGRKSFSGPVEDENEAFSPKSMLEKRRTQHYCRIHAKPHSVSYPDCRLHVCSRRNVKRPLPPLPAASYYGQLGTYRNKFDENKSARHFDYAELSKTSQKAIVEIPSSSCRMSKLRCLKKWQITDASTLWIEVAFKLDCLAYIICSISALTSPMVIFLPLIVTDGCGHDNES